MRLAADLALFSLLALSVATLIYAIVVLWRLRRGLRAAPPVERWANAPAPAGGWPSVCVIAPAHNEQRVIARLARSLLEQEYPSLRVVFALDRCTDATRDEIESVIGADERFEIIEIDRCPEEWAGKTHAAHHAWSSSELARRADVLLFTDADTWHHPRSIRAAVAAMRERDAGMLSLLSTLDAHRLWERALQPAAVFALLRQHPLDRVNSQTARRAFANGQYLMFTQETYRAVGTHESVKDALLEDIALAYRCKRTHQRWVVLPAGAMLRCRMYASRDAFLRGWRRIYLESARRIPRRLRAWGLELILTGALLPLAALLAALLGAASVATGRTDALAWSVLILGAVSATAWLASTVCVWRAQGAPAWSALLAPLGAWTVGLVMFAAARDLVRRRTLRWGGRNYTLAPARDPRAPATHAE
jgi:chlorobactene glucosyltransferase